MSLINLAASPLVLAAVLFVLAPTLFVSISQPTSRNKAEPLTPRSFCSDT